MTRPHDFGFDETAQIKGTARRLLQDHCAPEALHRLVALDAGPARASECVWDEVLWRRMQGLGWTAVAVPERLGGFGMGLVAIAWARRAAWARGGAVAPDRDPVRHIRRARLWARGRCIVAADRGWPCGQPGRDRPARLVGGGGHRGHRRRERPIERHRRGSCRTPARSGR